jgi:hypothetical protein
MLGPLPTGRLFRGQFTQPLVRDKRQIQREKKTNIERRYIDLVLTAGSEDLLQEAVENTTHPLFAPVSAFLDIHSLPIGSRLNQDITLDNREKI